MKRSGPLTRKTPLQSKSRLSRSGPVKKVNRERLNRRTKAYRAYMASPEWRTKRIQALLAAEYTCQRCGLAPEQGFTLLGVFMAAPHLHVHHKTYARFGHENLEDLEVLCESCHMREHAMNALRPRGLPGGR